MIKKVTEEYRKKITSGDVKELLKAPVYCMIINYLQDENLTPNYKGFLNKQNNILDYLYETFTKTRTTRYSDVKEVLDFDQDFYKEN